MGGAEAGEAEGRDAGRLTVPRGQFRCGIASFFGKVMATVVPFPFALVSVSVPPWASIRARAMRRPRPLCSSPARAAGGRLEEIAWRRMAAG